MPRVIAIPVIGSQASSGVHPRIERGARIGSQNVKGGGLDPLLDGPGDGAVKDAVVVVVHAKDKAAVDHHSEVMEPAHRLVIVAVEVLMLALLKQALRVECFKADKEAA